MKKTLKRLTSVALVVLMLASMITITLSAFAADYSYSGNVIYISDNGDDANDGKTAEKPVKTIKRAFAASDANPTIVITDCFSYGGSFAACTLAGKSSDSVLNVTNWAIKLTGDVTIKNLKLNATQNHQFLLACGNTLTSAENVVLTANEGVKNVLSIRGGDDGKAINKDTHVIIKSGNWNAVYGGTRNQDVNGNTYITIHDTANVSLVRGGNDSSADDSHALYGNAIIKLVGSKPGVANIAKSAGIKGKTYLDLTEYDGKITDNMQNLGATFIMGKEELSNIPPYEPSEQEPEEEAPPAVVYEVPEGAIFLSDKGNDSNDGKTAEKPVKTITRALVLGGSNPTVVVKDKYTISGNLAACTITGLNSNSVLNVNGWCLKLTGDVEIKNIRINALSNWSFVLAAGHTFTSGENVTLTTAEGVNPVMSIRGGDDGKNIVGDTNIIIKSGNWKSVFAGTAKGNVAGNAYVTVYDTASIGLLSHGNDSPSADFAVEGNSVIKFVGAKPGALDIRVPTDVKGTVYFDLTEYTGEINAKMKAVKATHITNVDEMPQFILDKQKEDLGVYDLPTDTAIVFLSDSGDDANDGKTKDTPKKTLDAAQDVLGKAGGTVVITGIYTHTSNRKPAGSVNITSTCKKDVFVWKNWALMTNTAELYNLKIQVAKDYAFFLHGGTPLVIGDNVTIENGPGTKYGLGIRAGEKGNFSQTDVTIKSGTIRTIFTGTKNGNILGDSSVTILGGSVENITVGNDSTEGRTLGNTFITAKGKPVIGSITSKSQHDGYVLVDFVDYERKTSTSVAGTLSTITDPDDRVIPIKANALYINGYPDGTFLPDKVMTRAEAITVVAKLCGLADGTILPEKTAFGDVTDADWFIRNVKYLEKNGMLDFFGGTLAANSGITRAEFVKLISPLVSKKDGEAPVFTDVPTTHKYYNEIILAAKAGLVNGYPDGTFLPENTLKRAEIVTILNRLARRNIVDKNANEVKKFSDIDGHWARNQIIAASSEPKAQDGLPVWYAGDKYSENTPFDASTLQTPLTDAVLAGVDVNDANAVMTAVEGYAAKRRAEIRNTPTAVEVTGTKYYVSESGDDANDGKSPETAWKSLTSVNTAKLVEGDGVFFKRGDTFRGQLKTQKGVTYSAYGEGAKPNLYGSLRDYSMSAFWEKTTEENVYVSKESFSKDVGLIVFNHGETWSDKQIVGKKDFKGTLDADLELYHNTSDKKLYLYSVSDPNTRFTSTEIAEGQNCITGNGNNVTIDNLCVKYVGAHGVGYGDGTTGLTVQNCEFGWIGGMIQRTSDNVRFGNAVEIYITAVDYTVDNCYIYEVYDAGVTHQYYQTRDAFVNMENIKYINNVIEKCTYNIEYINIQPEDRGIMKDVVISGNLLLYGGEGWGQQRPDHGEAVIMGGNSINYSENYRIVDNVIHTGDPDCDLVRLGVQRLASVPVVAGNLFIGKEGNRFGIYGLMGTAKQAYDRSIVEKNIGLDNNKFVYLG